MSKKPIAKPQDKTTKMKKVSAGNPADEIHLGDTAPVDNSHLPSPKPTAPGKEPTAPGSKKKPGRPVPKSRR